MHFSPEGFYFPAPLAGALARKFWGTETPSPAQLAPTGRTLAELWARLARGRGQEDEGHYSFQAPQAEAYAAYYLPANLMKVPLALAEAESLGLDFFGGGQGTWVDVGCGPGTAYAGLAWWCQQRVGPSRVIGIDQSPQFLKIAAEISGALASSLTCAVPPFVGRKVGRKPGAVLDAILAEDPRVVSFANSVAEIFPDPEARADSLRELARELGARARRDGRNRWLLPVEPGARDAGRELLELRAALSEEALARVALPCLDARACGALAAPKDWCHEEVRCEFPAWLNELGRHAGMRKESILFSYLLYSLGPSELPEAWPRGAARMVSQRLEHKGLTECWLCTGAGEKRRYRFSHSVQKKRETPLVVPGRGDIVRGLVASEKGEVEAFEPMSAPPDAFRELFPSSANP